MCIVTGLGLWTVIATVAAVLWALCAPGRTHVRRE